MTEDRINKEVFIKVHRYTYASVHEWIKKRCRRKMQCELCGTTESKRFHWANMNHLYRHNEWDWMELCPKCHVKHDFKNLSKKSRSRTRKWGRDYDQCIVCSCKGFPHKSNGKCERCYQLIKKYRILGTLDMVKNQMKKYIIESGKELSKEKVYKYPFRKMNVGDSFLSSDVYTRNAMSKLSSAARAWVKYNNLDWKFATKKDESGFIRIFRIQ